MKKLLFVLATVLLTAIALPANAQQLPSDIPAPSSQWLFGWYSPYNGGNVPPSQTDYNKYYRITGNARRIWVRDIYDWVNNTNVKTTFRYHTIWCDRNQIRTDYSIFYNSNRVAIGTDTRKSTPLYIEPNSKGEILFNAVCR